MARAPVALTITASDSSGVSGAQADIKTFSALGAYGVAALTAVMARDTQGEHDRVVLDPSFVSLQIDAVLGDLGADAVKTGMLVNADTIRAVAGSLHRWSPTAVVVDPSSLSREGGRLADAALRALREELLPLATVVTPNIEEAGLLVGRSLSTWDDARSAAQEIAGLGAANVVITGGRREGDTVMDLTYDGKDFRELATERVAAGRIRGTGDAFSAALAATLAKGEALPHAAAAAKAYVTKALQEAYELGRGKGPLHHFYRYWRPLMQ